VSIEAGAGRSGATQLDRSGIAEQVADLLRGWIMAGRYRPGAKLSEKSIQEELRISRNTLRESFRLLTKEQLLTHEPYKGVSVRRPTAEEVADLYRVRVLIECGALRQAGPSAPALPRIAAAVGRGEAAEQRADWPGVAAANTDFHQGIADLAGSPRVTELMRGIMSELRLTFLVMDDTRDFHVPYLARNRQIVDLLLAGDGPAAAELLAGYFVEAEAQLVGVFRRLEQAAAAKSAGQ
jgi:DNA-binding GntR family transcriptional regulator